MVTDFTPMEEIKGLLDREAISQYIRTGITEPETLGPKIGCSGSGTEIKDPCDEMVKLDVKGTDVYVYHVGDGIQFGVSFVLAGHKFHFFVPKGVLLKTDDEDENTP